MDNLDVVKLLLKNNAYVYLKNDLGDTPETHAYAFNLVLALKEINSVKNKHKFIWMYMKWFYMEVFIIKKNVLNERNKRLNN